MKPAAPGSKPDDDDTVKIAPGHGPALGKPVRRPFGVLFAGAMAIGVGTGTVGWFLWPHTEQVVVRPLPPIATPLPRPAEFRIVNATESVIRENMADRLTVFRLAANPNILILDFASLRDQGAMLNRLGAFAEKAGVPHDRLLNDAELLQAIQAGGDTAETYYYGHDYSAAEIARFFALADRDRVALNEQEESLRRLMRQEGWFANGKVGGLISVPKIGANAEVTADTRATILHHELSHGEYFSNPAYAAYTRQFWTSALTQAERDAMLKYLAKEAYDTANDMLMENEAQAYLIFTLNPAFFDPSLVGMTEARRAELRAIFLHDMPTDWLRDSAPPPPDIARASVR